MQKSPELLPGIFYGVDYLSLLDSKCDNCPALPVWLWGVRFLKKKTRQNCRGISAKFRL